MHSADTLEFWKTGRPTPLLAESGLRSVDDLDRSSGLSADERVILEKAKKSFGASHVFFRARAGRPKVAEALVFDDACSKSTRTDDDFAKLHRRLWSWGAVPLVYRRLPGRVDMFRCAHKPDFDTGREQPKYSAYQSLNTAGEITQLLEGKPWWDMWRLANGSLWDDKATAEQFLSEDSAHKTLLKKVEALDTRLEKESHLAKNLRRRLLVISLLVAYLEDRQVFKLEPGFFSRFKPGAQKFFHVLADAGLKNWLAPFLNIDSADLAATLQHFRERSPCRNHPEQPTARVFVHVSRLAADDSFVRFNFRTGTADDRFPWPTGTG